jgi:NHL repeat
VRRLAAGFTLALAAAAVAVSSSASGTTLAPSAVATIVTVAGTGVDGHDGDGGPATSAAIDHPRGFAVLADGSLLFAEPFLNTVRRVDPNGIITTLAGSGMRGYSGDGGPAVLARLDLVHGVALLPDGSFVVDDMGNNRLRRVAPDGTISTVVGTGDRGFSGDGGPATAAQLSLPRGIASRSNGELLVADSSNSRIRRVSPGGIITTVAGTGAFGFSGDGGSATAAELNRPFGVAPLPNGGFLIADVLNHRIRRVSANGTISTVAGTGTAGFSGDGGPAVEAKIAHPHNVAVLPDGGFLIADTGNHRVRRVWPNGVITTGAGTGVAGFSGDNGPAADAQLFEPKAVAVRPDRRGFWVADAFNHRVRFVALDLRPPLTVRLLGSPVRGREGNNAQLRFVLSEQARARLDVLRRARTVLTLYARGRGGRNTVRFGRTLRPGSYALRLRATTADGRTGGDLGRLVVQRRP